MRHCTRHRSITFLAWALLALTPVLAFAEEDSRAEAADFTLAGLDGEDVRLADLKGKVVVVNFWATWCKPCMQELPLLDEMNSKYQEQGLVVLAIATDGPETVSEVRSAVRRKRWKMSVLLDQEGDLSSVMNPRGTNPFTVFIDRKGRVAFTHEGYAPGDEKIHQEHIEKLLAEGSADDQ